MQVYKTILSDHVQYLICKILHIYNIILNNLFKMLSTTRLLQVSEQMRNFFKT